MKTLEQCKTTDEINAYLEEIRNLETLKESAADPEYIRLEEELDKIEDPITKFLKFVSNLTAKELGNLFASYVSDTTYDMNWEGFSPQDKVGIRKLLWDMMIVFQHARLSSPDYYGDKFNYFTGTHYLLKGMDPETGKWSD